MKCPLLVGGTITSEEEYEAAAVDCLKEECAWWDKTDEQCIIQTIPFELNRMGSALQCIEQKMPHEEQFRR